MTFKEVRDLVMNIIDEIDVDEQIEVIINGAINYSYMMIASKVDKTSEIVNLKYSKYVKLPDDFASLIDIVSGDNILSKTEYSLKSNMLIFHTNEFQDMSLIYNKLLKPLVNDSDVLNIDDRYCMACAMYGAYVYSVHRKRVELANLLYNDFTSLIKGKDVKVEVNGFDI